MDAKAKVAQETKEQFHKIRITLSSTNHVNLEKASSDIARDARNKDLKVKGPVRLPTKILKITTRKTTCGEGTNSWHRYQMRVHKRIIDFHATPSAVQEVTSLIQPGVEIELSVS